MELKLLQFLSKEIGTLTEKEILAELQKLGINTTSELNSYLNEYYNYILTQQYSK